MLYEDEPEVEEDDREHSENPYDAVEPTEPECGVCHNPLDDLYYTQGATIVCPGCHDAAEEFLNSGSGALRFTRAMAFGLMAAAGGAVVMGLFVTSTGFFSGLISVAVGALVGKAVMKGTNDRGGLKYQALAVLLTYSAVAWSYLPTAAKAVVQFVANNPAPAQEEPENDAKPEAQPGAPAKAKAKAGNAADANDKDKETSAGEAIIGITVLATITMACAYVFPFLLLPGRGALFGLVLIFFALRQAWTMTRMTRVVFHGPFEVGEGSCPA